MAEKNNGPNWESIKAEYVSTDISMRNLAEKHGVNPNTLQSHAQHEKWSALRQEATHKANAKLVQRAANQRAKMMAMGQDIGADLLKQVQAIVAKAEKQTATRTRSETVTAKHVKELNMDVPVHDMTETDLVKLANMYATVMRTLGFDEASKVARDRLEVDRLKVEMRIEPDMEKDERPIIVDERPWAEDADAEQS